MLFRSRQLAESKRVPLTGKQVRTPLLEVLFWRILLDEAQIVAGASGKATEMIHELWRSNCWMVTGTPVTKGIRDIQGIFAFLDHDPFAAPRFFRDIIRRIALCTDRKAQEPAVHRDDCPSQRWIRSKEVESLFRAKDTTCP